MKERPILFSAEMVRAILNGSKTQTRRLVRGVPNEAVATAQLYDPHEVLFDAPKTGGILRRVQFHVGDRLWVREAIRHIKGGERSVYLADEAWTKADAWPWRKRSTLSGLFCPRGLSRITLEVTVVRVEHLQDITAEDSLAEGVPRASTCGCEVCRCSAQMCPADAGEQVMAYAALWNRLYGKRSGCAWSDNPWVWAISFRQVMT